VRAGRVTSHPSRSSSKKQKIKIIKKKETVDRPSRMVKNWVERKESHHHRCGHRRGRTNSQTIDILTHTKEKREIYCQGGLILFVKRS
jgi:hypothetical protein